MNLSSRRDNIYIGVIKFLYRCRDFYQAWKYHRCNQIFASLPSIAPKVQRIYNHCNQCSICVIYFVVDEKKPGSDLLFHTVTSIVPSALMGLTSLFGMDRGVSPSVMPPGIFRKIPRSKCQIPNKSQFPKFKSLIFLLYLWFGTYLIFVIWDLEFS